MRFIQKWSFACARGLARKQNDSNSKRREYYFAFQMLIGGALTAITIAAAAFLLGILIETAAVVFFFGILRAVAGGYNIKNNSRRMLTSIAMFLPAGLLVKYTHRLLPPGYITALTIAVLILGLSVLIKRAPADTPDKPITDPDQIRKLKIYSVIEISAGFIASLVLISFGLGRFALAGCLGVLLAAFMLSSAGYRFFGMISGRYY